MPVVVVVMVFVVMVVVAMTVVMIRPMTGVVVVGVPSGENGHQAHGRAPVGMRLAEPCSAHSRVNSAPIAGSSSS